VKFYPQPILCAQRQSVFEKSLVFHRSKQQEAAEMRPNDA
jgi:hypothetical protein